ncbi:hypothetical protein KBD81_00735 [Candidatus Woesebacteria bacterium]|nr:hypothetical protein [Candidatus Woesebacteria bacterium]
MLQPRPEGYVGKQFAEGYTNFIVAGPYLGIVSIEEGMSQDDGKQLLEEFKQGLLSTDVSSLSSFETTVSNLILSLNFPAHVALALGMHKDGILYLKCIGAGQVYFRRGTKLDLLVSGDSSASGYLKEFDMVIFSTSAIETLIGTAHDLSAFVDLASPSEILQKIHTEEYGEEDQGFVSLFVEFNAKQPVRELSILDEMEPKINDPISSITDSDRAEVSIPQPPGMQVVDILPQNEKIPATPNIRGLIRNKVFIGAVVVVLFALLAWSVVFGYQRRQAQALSEKVLATQTEVEAKMIDAQEGAFLNLQASLGILSDVKTQVAKLKTETGNSHASTIAEMEKLIADTEASIMKKDEVESSEFYDLTLEAEDASGDTLGVDGTSVAILDSKAKKVYVLDLEKKSLDEYVNPDLTDASSVTVYNGDVFVYHKSKGVMKFVTQSKLNPIIEADSEWGSITDLEVYNGNIYLLDTGNNEIYKYLVTEGGYSDKRPYFSSSEDISDATGMVIDSAIYVSSASQISKYISGADEAFDPQFPHEGASFDSIYTDENSEHLYALDTAQSSVYILSKDGEFERQLQSSVFKNAKGLYFFDGSVHVLSGSSLSAVSAD